VCNATEDYTDIMNSGRHFSEVRINEFEDGRKWTELWMEYTVSLLLKSQHFKKVSAQVGVDFRKLGSVGSTGMVAYDRTELIEYFASLCQKTAPRDLKSSEEINHVEIFATDDSKAKATKIGVPGDRVGPPRCTTCAVEFENPPRWSVF
jgi:hypothetical protein